MKARPILMSGPVVRSTLREIDPKTQTRRTTALGKVNECPDAWNDVRCFDGLWSFRQVLAVSGVAAEELVRCPYGVPGDRLWVRETTSESEPCFLGGRAQPTVWYRADNNRPTWAEKKWTPSILSPRRLSRITLEITFVRVERLNDCSQADARAEGCDGSGNSMGSAFADYVTLWESINGPGSWATNPWVWVVEFKRVVQP